MLVCEQMVKGFVTTKELAERLGISAPRVRQMILDGLIKGVEKIGPQNLIPEREAARLEALGERKPGRPRKSEHNGLTAKIKAI